MPFYGAAQSCRTQFAGTEFEPKSGISGVCELEDVRLYDSSSESFATSLTYSSSGSVSTGQYCVNNGELLIGVVSGYTTLLSYSLTDLITTSGQNTYSIAISGYVTLTSGCTDPKQSHRTNIIFRIGNQQEPLNREGTSQETSFNFNIPFTATSSKMTLTVQADHSNFCGVLHITSIVVTGCVEQKISSENGNTVCAGADNLLFAKGLNASSYVWEQAPENSSSWTTIAQTTQSITVTPSETTQYRVTANGTTLGPLTLRTMVCCSQSGTRSYDFENWAETFTFAGVRSALSDPNEIENYQYQGSGNITEGYYALLKNAQDGGQDASWFIDMDGHTSEMDEAPASQKGTNDGLLLINADSRYAGSIFYRKRIDNICPNTMYDFSAYIANAAATANGAPVNVRFVVFGGDDSVTETTGDTIANVASGDIAAGTRWVEKGASFNSKNYEHVYITIQDNVAASEYPSVGVGNDIAIDDITFSTCSPEINLYSNAAFTSQDTTVCSQDGSDVSLTLEVGAVYDLANFFAQPYFLLQSSSSASGPWTNISEASTSSSLAISVPATQTENMYYRAWVGASKSVVEAAAAGNAQSGCGSITAVSNPISVRYACPCTTPEFNLSGPGTVCISSPSATLTVSGITIGDRYSWTKNGTEVETGTISNVSNPITYTDSNVGAAGETVIYACTIYNEDCSATMSDTITVADRISMSLTSSALNDSICTGESVTINSNYSLQSGESLVWYADGAEIAGQTGAILSDMKPTANTLYRAELAGGSCDGGGEITISVSSPASPSLTISADTICAGGTIDISDSDTAAADRYVWYISSDGSTFTELAGQTGKDITGYAPAETSYFKKQSVSGRCQTESNVVMVYVGGSMNLSATASPAVICVGDSSTLTVSGQPSGASLRWVDNNFGTDISTEASVKVSPEANTTYTVYVVDVCEASTNVSLEVKAAIDPQVGSSEYNVCLGSKVNITAQGYDVVSYRWSPETGLDDPTAQAPAANPTVSTRYTVTMSNGSCSDTISTLVSVRPLPSISTIEDSRGDDCSTRTLTLAATGGTSPYQYSFDGIEYSTSDTYEGLTAGWLEIYVKDSYECLGDTAYYLEPYPISPAIFFSPNSDGMNETWTIGNIECYPSYIIEIYDRDGRKLFDARKGSFSSERSTIDFEGWDGNYNGHQMPSGDYWYLITLETVRRQYRGHFTLKR